MNNKFIPNYIKCLKCGNTLDLSFVDKSCPNPLCSFNFTGLSELLNEDDEKLMTTLVEAHRGYDEDRIALVIVAVRYNIGNYLAHFIECTWGAHYNSLYKHFITLHLKDLNILKKVLSSDVIKEDKNNIIISQNGYKMFWALYKYLINIKSVEISGFLKEEFPKYWRDWYRKIHGHPTKND
jgi:hypothetical protein